MRNSTVLLKRMFTTNINHILTLKLTNKGFNYLQFYAWFALA